MSHTPLHIDKTWSLFLDRDGVINNEIAGTYVTDWGEFSFCEGALTGLQQLAGLFGTTVIVTNQRGVGRGIMTGEALKDIHRGMKGEIISAGGRIDRIYTCTAVADNDHNRKPNTGMALQAHEDFPDINFKKSVMVGNSLSDMEFGKRMGMHTVFITSIHAPYELPNDLIDEQYESLAIWADSLKPATVF